MIQQSVFLTILLCLIECAIDSSKAERIKRVKTETIPEFFDDDLNIYALIAGFGIILVCGLIGFLIFKLKSRSAAFENSLFQNLEE